MGLPRDKSLFGRSLWERFLERSTHLRSGVGEVGYWVVKYAVENGAKVTISDIYPKAIEKPQKHFQSLW